MTGDPVLGLPDSALRWREWWQQVTGRRIGSGPAAVTLLARALGCGKLLELDPATEQTWYEVFSYCGDPEGGEMLRRLLTCARLAAIRPDDPAKLERIAAELPWVHIGSAASRSNGGWDVRVQESIWQSPEGSVLRPRNSAFTPAVASDLVQGFWEQYPDRLPWARRPTRTQTVVALLVDRRLEGAGPDARYQEEGATAQLTVELLPHGRGEIYPDPRGLLFVRQDERFRRGIENARAAAEEFLEGVLSGHDVRWNLRRHDGEPLTELSGDSAAAAFAAVFACLWRNPANGSRTQRFRNLDLASTAVSATLKKQPAGWRFSPVSALPAKAWAASQRSGHIKVVYIAPGHSSHSFPSLRLLEVSSLHQLLHLQAAERKRRRAPRRQLVIAMAAVAAASAFATLGWAHRLRRHESALWLHRLRSKSLVSLFENRYSLNQLEEIQAQWPEGPLKDALFHIYIRDFDVARRALAAAKRQGLAELSIYHSLSGDLHYFQNQFDLAVPHYRVAAEKATPDDFDERTDLALALQRSQDDPTDKIEEALRIHRQILSRPELTVAPRSDEGRRDWGRAQLNLAKLLIDRPLFKQRSVVAGLATLEKAREAFARDPDPRAWAVVSGTMGVAWQNRLDGARDANLEHSIPYLSAALSVFQRFEEGALRAGFLRYMIGNALAQLRDADRAANIERAIDLYDRASEILERAGGHRDELARVWRLRGLVLQGRRCGDRDANIEEAVADLRRALDVFVKDHASIDAAKTKADIAHALMLRASGVTGTSLEGALELLHEGEGYLSREKFETEWSGIATELGTAYHLRTAGGVPRNLSTSLAYLQCAVSVRMKTGRLDRRIASENALARTLVALGGRARAEGAREWGVLIASAISVLADAVALEEQGGAGTSEYRAETAMGLGDAWSTLAFGGDASNREVAVECYRAALLHYEGQPYYERERADALRRLEALESTASQSRRASRLDPHVLWRSKRSNRRRGLATPAASEAGLRH